MSTELHSLWRLAAGQPQLLAAHAAGYAALMRDEGAVLLQQVLLRGRLQALVFGGAVAGVVLAGVALMLWAVLPQPTPLATAVLFGVPLGPLAVSAWALYTARHLEPLRLWVALQRQLAADRALLQCAMAPTPVASSGSRGASS
jgi:hypothetical protein